MNTANKLTILRVLLIPLFMAILYLGIPGANYWALVIFIAASLTDMLDGYIARHYNQITDFGKFMDPLADKIFVASCMLLALEYRLMPAWIAIAVLSREFMVTGLRSLAAKKGIVIAADKFGKIKTALQMFMLGIVGMSWIHIFDLWTKGTWQWWIWTSYLTGVVIITLYSGAAYFIKYRHVFMDDK